MPVLCSRLPLQPPPTPRRGPDRSLSQILYGELLKQALNQNKDKELEGFVEYLTELSRDIDKIVAGGPLIPD